ncbi:hypothetical protein D3C71_2055440 [compost metagenome]
MTNHLVDRGKHRFGKLHVAQVGRDHLQLVHDEIVAALVQRLGGHTGLHMGGDHAQHLGRQLCCLAGHGDFGRRFDWDAGPH